MAKRDDDQHPCVKEVSKTVANSKVISILNPGKESSLPKSYRPILLHECSHEIHTTIPTSSFYLDKIKQFHTKSRQNNLHSVYAGPFRIYEQSGPYNKQQCTTHGNAPKGSGCYLRPKTHIQHTCKSV